MSNPYRDEKTQKFAKRGNWKVKFVVIVILLSVAGYYGYPHIKQFVKNVDFVNHYNAKPVEVAPVKTQEEVKASDIEKRMQEVKTRADHKAKVAKFDDVEARRVATSEYEKSEKDKYDAIQKEIKASNDIVKKDQISF